MSRAARQFGFTLMELLLVMLIIAISAAVVAPAFRGWTRGRRLPNTATALVSTARWCRVKAISENAMYRLNFDITAGTWWVTKDDGTGSATFTQVTDEMGKEYTLTDGITMLAPTFEESLFPNDTTNTEAGTYVTFYPGGRTDVVTITLVCDNQTLDVACEMPLATFHVLPAGGTR